MSLAERNISQFASKLKTTAVGASRRSGHTTDVSPLRVSMVNESSVSFPNAGAQMSANGGRRSEER